MTVPSDLSGLVLWLEADTIPGLNDGDPISTWPDDSGEGNDATGAGATRPIYRTNILNGLPIARFDGADNMDCGNDTSMRPAQFSAFAVTSYTGTAPAPQGGTVFNYGAGTDSADFGRGYGLFLDRNDVNCKKGSGDTSEEVVTGPRIFTGTVHTYMDGHYDGSELFVYERSILRGTSTPDTQGISYINVVGLFLGMQRTDADRFFLIGDIGEVIIYDHYLTDDERGSIQKYLADKWFPAQPRYPLAEDIDTEDGTRLYMTVWNDSVLTLQRRTASTLVLESQTSLGTAAEADVAAKTYFVVPRTPHLPGVANFGDIVYVFGRWDESGTIRHIMRSVDGGVTLTDIGDASWTTERVGALSVSDGGATIYAFLNSASPALWLSTDSGASWAQVNTLPFSVEWEAVNRHGGAAAEFIIGNNVAEAEMGAFLETPYTDTWIGATGPAGQRLPVAADGGSNIASIVWI